MENKFKKLYRISSARLKNWDYSFGYYHVTICTHNRIQHFGKIQNSEMTLSSVGKIAKQFWSEIPKHCPYAELDEFIIMPDHIHGIIILSNGLIENGDVIQRMDVANRRDVACNVSTIGNVSPKKGSLSVVIRSFKSAVTKWCNQNGYNHFKWQERFYDRIIRSELQLFFTRKYIMNNLYKHEAA